MRWSSLFALVVLALPLSVSAQSASSPPRLLTVAPDGKPQTLGITRADILVEIAGPLAQTTMTMTFKNGTARILQGELDFPLPEGATISGYGLDVDGKMRDGVPVEKQEARIAFEKEVRKGADPGLAEQTVGNSFRTRVYPIPANGTRTVKVQYVTGLLTSGSDFVSRVPLRWNQVLPDAQVTIVADQTGVFPRLNFGERTQLLTFEKQGESYRATKTFENASFDTDLEIRLPDAALRPLTLTEPFTRTTLGEPETYFVASDVPPFPVRVDGARPIFRRIGLVWDASFSRRSANRERECQILRDLLRTSGPVTIDVTVLRNVAEPVRSFSIVNGNTTALEAFLKGIPCDGGTQLGVAPFPTAASNGTRYDVHLFFSDGLGNLGRDMPFPAVVPVYCISSTATANHALLRHVSERSGGVYLNLSTISDTQAVAMIGKPAFSLLSVTLEQGKVADLFPVGQVPVQGRVFITGRLQSGEARLRLHYGIDGRITHTETVTIHRHTETGSGMAGRFWAQRKAEDLMLLPKQNQEWLLSLGKDFNMVTANTSLMVLERIDQYIEHGITPPRTSPELYLAYQNALRDGNVRRKQTETDKISRMVALWNEKVAWWNKRFAQTVARPVPKQSLPSVRQLRTVAGTAGTLSGPVTTLSAQATPVPSQIRSASRAVTGGAGESRVVYGDVHGVPGGTIRANVALSVSPAAAVASPDFDEVDELAADRVVTRVRVQEKAVAGEIASASITIKPWSPDTPYLKAMKASPTNAYAIYLKQRDTYADSPAFYLDCAEFLFQRHQPELGLRVLTNILELRLEDPQLMRIVAHRLAQLQSRDLAIGLFEQVTRMRPEEPQSWRDLALILADRADASITVSPTDAATDYKRALELLNKIVLGHWDRFDQIEMIALMEANRIISHANRLPAAVKPTFKNPIDARLIKNLECDLRIVMTWDSDSTDMDLWVDEPTGERCIYNHNLTAIGGHLSRDFTDGYGPEEYLLHRAPKGVYQIRTNYFGERQQRLTGGTTVQATVYTNFGRSTEKKQTLTLRLSTAKQTVDIGAARIDGNAQ